MKSLRCKTDRSYWDYYVAELGPRYRTSVWLREDILVHYATRRVAHRSGVLHCFKPAAAQRTWQVGSQTKKQPGVQKDGFWSYNNRVNYLLDSRTMFGYHLRLKVQR
jgi:hypothetical protein